ncbi:MAG: hypothetical protein AABX77_02325 [Nanoarchaeota archaeon]
MEEYDKLLKEAIRHLQIADHMTYVTLPLINENRLLLKIFDEIYLSIIKSINSILSYEHFCKRINLYTNYSNNLETFVRIAKNYDISNEQLRKIKEIININNQHKQSAVEFVKRDRVVIMSDNLRTQIIDIRIIKQYLLFVKELIVKTSRGIK